MPLRIKQKTKKDIQTPNPNKKCMYLKYRYITLPKKPILLANIVLLFLLDIAVLFSTMENISGKEAPPHIFYSQNKTLQHYLKEFSRKPEEVTLFTLVT